MRLKFPSLIRPVIAENTPRQVHPAMTDDMHTRMAAMARAVVEAVYEAV